MFLPLSASAVTMVPLRTALLASHQLFLWSTPGAKVLSVKAGAGNCPAAHWTTRPSTAPASRTASGRRSITRGRPAPARSARRNAGLTGKECNFECVGVFERGFCLLKGIAEGTYKSKHAEAARLYYTTTTTTMTIHTHTHTPTEL